MWGALEKAGQHNPLAKRWLRSGGTRQLQAAEQPESNGDQGEPSDHGAKEDGSGRKNVAKAIGLGGLVDHRDGQANGKGQPEPIVGDGQGLAEKAGKTDGHALRLLICGQGGLADVGSSGPNNGVKNSKQIQQAGYTGIKYSHVIRPIANKRAGQAGGPEMSDNSIQTGKNLGHKPKHTLSRVDDAQGADIEADEKGQLNSNEQQESPFAQAEIEVAGSGYEPGQDGSQGEFPPFELGSIRSHPKTSISGNANDLGQAGDSCAGLGNSVLAKYGHSFVHGQALHVLGGGGAHDQLT